MTSTSPVPSVDVEPVPLSIPSAPLLMPLSLEEVAAPPSEEWALA